MEKLKLTRFDQRAEMFMVIFVQLSDCIKKNPNHYITFIRAEYVIKIKNALGRLSFGLLWIFPLL